MIQVPGVRLSAIQSQTQIGSSRSPRFQAPIRNSEWQRLVLMLQPTAYVSQTSRIPSSRGGYAQDFDAHARYLA